MATNVQQKQQHVCATIQKLNTLIDACDDGKDDVESVAGREFPRDQISCRRRFLLPDSVPMVRKLRNKSNQKRTEWGEEK